MAFVFALLASLPADETRRFMLADKRGELMNVDARALQVLAQLGAHRVLYEACCLYLGSRPLAPLPDELELFPDDDDADELAELDRNPRAWRHP